MTAEPKTDRIMWFSMWFLGAVATFGLAFFPFFYYSVERRNAHFKKQQEFERKIYAFNKTEESQNVVRVRNSRLWTAAVVLVFPVFAIAYFLSADLNAHEKRQKELFSRFFPELVYTQQKISIKICALITIATLGLGVVYWLYKIVNGYNNHFKEQRHLEHEMLRLMEAESRIESL